jgi:hypothetical protein
VDYGSRTAFRRQGAQVPFLRSSGIQLERSWSWACALQSTGGRCWQGDGDGREIDGHRRSRLETTTHSPKKFALAGAENLCGRYRTRCSSRIATILAGRGKIVRGTADDPHGVDLISKPGPAQQRQSTDLYVNDVILSRPRWTRDLLLEIRTPHPKCMPLISDPGGDRRLS